MNPEAIEAAAKALIREESGGCYKYHPKGHTRRDDMDRYAEEHAKAALEAAAPHLIREARAAELEAAAFAFTGDFITGDYNSTPQQVGDFLRDRAAAIRDGAE